MVVNRTDTVKGTTTPGASVSVPVTAQKEGMLSLAVRTKNDVGYSPFTRTSHYVGSDQPVAPTNVILAISPMMYAVSQEQIP